MLPLIALLVGCGSPPTPAAATPSYASSVQAAMERMHVRYAAALDLETAIALGDLMRIRVDARTIDVAAEPGASDAVLPLVASVRDAAHRVAIADSVETAGERATAMATACGNCHQATHAAVRFLEPAPAPDNPMQHHQWAGRQMWEGLIAPDDNLWRAGASGLSVMPKSLLANAATRSQADDLDDVMRIERDAARALEMPGQDVRAALLGRILASCAHCHATMRDL